MTYKPAQLRKFLGRTDCPVIVDVRSKREYRQAHIPGAIHIAFWMMPFRYKLLKDDREKQIIVYCEHGPRAVFARQSLQSKGFDKTECLEGHMLAWRKAGFPTEKE